MERVCFTFEIYPDKQEEYKQRHDEIWPEMVDALKESGFSNYTLFRRDTTIYAYVECQPDKEMAFERMGSTEVNQRWSEWFQDVIVKLTDDEGRLLFAEEVWHLD